ncbi:ATP-dependent Clp protease proteolytic subunit-related protein 3, chloroplastic [Mucuna pruriens]|uniref:ATP-dependent Clp protease proteolytic subunit-related protein 3, chloroplastic n=1 Tax=Mucuna pruriens TaxID=157652 RepID=A0A371HQQ4_MUCPR|nr:ATP-dependent Clp protease proteolytic subunit-related protein 3, chloroplastic [Mucuna pruriens]
MIGGTMMAAYLGVPMPTSPQSPTPTRRRCTNLRTSCSINATTNKAKIPMPPLNPNDPFLSKLASVAATSPETLLNPPLNSDTLPYLDIFDPPKLMATPAQVERSVSYNEHRPRRPPPDLPSLLLHGRIVYIGMPLVPAVTELVVAELMYLQYMDPKEPIYIYINSTGTTRDDGETVGMETEGFAIYDAMMQLKNEIHTVAVGAAIGQACLLLSAGTPGKRFMMPHAKAMIQQPRIPSSGLMPASDVLIRAKEVIINRDTLVKLLAKHTGNSEVTVANVMKRPFYMDSTRAKEFGVIDKILWRGQEKVMSDVASPDDWDKGAGIKKCSTAIHRNLTCIVSPSAQKAEDYPSISFRFALFLSFSLTAWSSLPPLPVFSKRYVPSSSSIPKATSSDLLSLLGSKPQSLAVNPAVARELKSCFKFLVPFSPLEPRHRKLGLGRASTRRQENELIWWPPEPVLELARLAVDSGGDPAAIHRLLDPTIIPVPDVEGSKQHRCQLTRTPYGRRFICEELNLYLQFLFELIVDRGPSVGLDVTLSRFDLFHGHLFLALDSGRLGILFHAKEYPAYDKQVFPYNMGFCQRGSNVTYDDSMNLRNILWLAPLPGDSDESWVAPGVLVVLDARPDGIIYRDLIPDYVQFARTIYEDDLGDVAVDVNYLNVGSEIENYQIVLELVASHCFLVLHSRFAT